MLKDLIIIDDFFDDTDSILKLASEEIYYENENIMTYWVGKRTKELLSRQFETYYPIMNSAIEKCSNFKLEYSWTADMFFHRLYEESKYQPSWIHADVDNIYAAVVYLNKNAPKNLGTIVDGTLAENVFNRLVMYRADLPHTPVGGFGETDEDARLTLNIFIRKLTINIDYEHNTIAL